MARNLKAAQRESPTGLTYPSVIGLRKILGPYSQFVDLTELATDYFVTQAAAHSKGPAEFIKAVKATCKVPSNFTTPLPSLRDWSPRVYVTHGVAVTSAFLGSFVQEIQDLRESGEDWATAEKGKNLSALEQLRKNLVWGKALIRRVGAEMALLEYYRKCRNAFLHALVPLDFTEAESTYEVLAQKHVPDIQARYHRTPRRPTEVRHGDYVLLARALLVLADTLSDLAELTPEQAARVMVRDPAAFAGLMKQRGNPENLRVSAAHRAVEAFWAHPDAARAVAEIVAAEVERAPSKRERRRAR